MTPFVLALLLAQAQPVKIVDPATPTRAAGVEACTGGKTCLDVKVVESVAGGGGSGPSQVTTDIRDAGIVQQQLADVLAQLAAIKAKTDNLDVLLSTRTKPADTQPVSAAALPLPGGAAQEHTGAASPNSSRLSDGAAFYKGASAGDSMGRTWSLSSGSDSVTATGPVTDAQLRASPLPVSGSLNQGASSDGGVPWPVDWSGALNDGGRVASEGSLQSLLQELQSQRALQQQMVELLQQTVEYVSKLKEPGR